MDSKKLRKSYMQNVPRLKKALEYVQSSMSDFPKSDFIFESNIKPYPSVKRKVEEDDVRDPMELSDLVRGRLFFSKEFNFNDVIGIIKKIFKGQVSGIDKKSNKPDKHGLEYHGIIHIELNIDGVKFEMQLVPIKFRQYNPLLHKIYEKLRNPKESDKLTDKQKDFLKKIHNNIYKELDNKN